VLLALAALQGLRLSLGVGAAVVATGALMWALRAGAFRYISQRISEPYCAVLGVAVVLSPLGGAASVATVALLFLWIERGQIRSGWLGAALPLWMLAVAWLGVGLWTEHSAQSAWYLVGRNGSLSIWEQLEQLLAWYRGNTTAPIRTLDWIARLVTILGIAAVFAHASRKFDALCAGLVVGLMAGMPVVGWQLLMQSRGEALSATFTLQQKFWDTLQRIPATFTDPNAFGVAMLLMLPILWEYARRCTPRWATLTRGIVMMSLVLVAFSGSRIGALGLLIVAAGAMLRRPRLAVGAALAALVLIAVLNGFPSVRQLATAPSMPETVRRVADGVVVSNVSQTFFSRAVFLQISARLLAANPWLGIGLERYRDYVVQLSTGAEGVQPLWSDNSNNFYLGLAAELGVLGFLCFLALVSSFRLRQSAAPLVRWTLGAFAVALLFGPHIEFCEVAILFGALLAATVEPRAIAAAGGAATRAGIVATNHRGWAVAVAIALIPAIAIKGSFSQYGFYPWERDGARFFRWTGMQAQGWVLCAPGAETTALYLRASRPPGVAMTPTVKVSAVGAALQLVPLQGDAISKVELLCPGEDREVFLQYAVTVEPPYFGWRRGSLGDARLLGVQVISRDPAATLPF